MALLHEGEGDPKHKDKRSNKAQRADTRRNLKRHEFVIVAKFGGHVLCCLVSSLSNVTGAAPPVRLTRF